MAKTTKTETAPANDQAAHILKAHQNAANKANEQTAPVHAFGTAEVTEVLEAFQKAEVVVGKSDLLAFLLPTVKKDEVDTVWKKGLEPVVKGLSSTLQAYVQTKGKTGESKLALPAPGEVEAFVAVVKAQNEGKPASNGGAKGGNLKGLKQEILDAPEKLVAHLTDLGAFYILKKPENLAVLASVLGKIGLDEVEAAIAEQRAAKEREQAEALAAMAKNPQLFALMKKLTSGV